MPVQSVADFCDALYEIGLLQQSDVENALAQAPQPPADPQEFAKQLIRLKLITIYQAKKLLAGRGADLVIGGYLISDKLGEGGMGKVFKATQRNMGRVVALKVLRTTLLNNDTALRRFRREVKAAAQLAHPNIVRVFDADEVDDRLYLAMEYIDGTDLSVMVKNHGPLPITTACSYIRQAALGLAHAHEIGLIHRDVKPSNFLVASGEQRRYGPRSVVKLLDLGLARVQHNEDNPDDVSTELTRMGTVVGTPDYMSPEQAKNSSTVDSRSDLYSLGCTFYYLLTGEVVFPRGNAMEKLLQHQMDAPRNIQLLRMDTPSEVATILHCLLEKRPDDRFATATALANALEKWADVRGSVNDSAPSPAYEPLPSDYVEETTTAAMQSATPTRGSPFEFNDDSPTEVNTKTTRKSPPPVPSAKRNGPPPLPSAKPRWRWVKRIGIGLGVLLGLLIILGILNDHVFKKSDPPVVENPPTQNSPTSSGSGSPTPVPVDPTVDRYFRYLLPDTQFLVVLDWGELFRQRISQESIVQPLTEKLKILKVFGIEDLSEMDKVVISSAEELEETSMVHIQMTSNFSSTMLENLAKLPTIVKEDIPDSEFSLYFSVPKEDEPITYLAINGRNLFISKNRERLMRAVNQTAERIVRLDNPEFRRISLNRLWGLKNNPAILISISGKANLGELQLSKFDLSHCTIAFQFSNRNMAVQAAAPLNQMPQLEDTRKKLISVFEETAKKLPREKKQFAEQMAVLLGALSPDRKKLAIPALRGSLTEAETKQFWEAFLALD
ncbi:MAG: serine/threonine-protein kinase [Zavarzinella sp.]